MNKKTIIIGRKCFHYQKKYGTNEKIINCLKKNKEYKVNLIPCHKSCFTSKIPNEKYSSPYKEVGLKSSIATKGKSKLSSRTNPVKIHLTPYYKGGT